RQGNAHRDHRSQTLRLQSATLVALQSGSTHCFERGVCLWLRTALLSAKIRDGSSVAIGAVVIVVVAIPIPTIVVIAVFNARAAVIRIINAAACLNDTART